jgi:hypothetical protein
MGFEFRDERAAREEVFDELEKTGDEWEMGTFLVSWQTGTGLEMYAGCGSHRLQLRGWR